MAAKKIAGLLALGSLLSILTACALPTLEHREQSYAISQDESAQTRLGQFFAPSLAQQPELSGVLPLDQAMDAFAARMLLIAAAQRSIDIQYYIWRDDITGNLLLYALHEAAQRGVRVRLLLDDNGISGLDSKLAVLNAQPGVEVRLFNPFPFRAWKRLGYLTDFSRLNRRMHNKSLTVDGQLTIVGGRNVGDEYFGATQDVAFADLDVLAVGPIVDEMEQDFDRYWNSESAYPVSLLIARPHAEQAQILVHDEAMTAKLAKAQVYVQAVAQSNFIEQLFAGRLEFLWVPVHIVSDDPAKVLDQASEAQLLTTRLQAVLSKPELSVDIVSPYFIPTEQGVEILASLVRQGIQVRVLTNSLEATDVLPVHAAYAKYRIPLLQSGVALYEMRSEKERIRPKEKAGPFGSSGTSLHAKTFAIDGKRVFIGSFNFDPRSARLNTELGFVIESPVLAKKLAEAFDQGLGQYAYQLGLNEKQQLIWQVHTDKEPQVLTSEPGANIWTNLYLRFLSLLPIEPLL